MSRRGPVLVLILALLVGGVLVTRDDLGGATDDTVDTVDASTLLPVAAPDGTLGSVWFCAGQSAGEDTPANGTLVIANPSGEPATGEVEVVADTGDRKTVDLEVEPWTTNRVQVAEVLEATWAAARVETTSGAVVVEHEVEGPEGRDIAACQTRAGDRWLLPAGASTRDATMTLLVYNPSSASATVDMAFATDQGERRPGDLQGLPVPAGEVVAVDVSAVVTVRPVFSTTVTTRTGRVVVDRIQTYDGRGAATTEEEQEAERFRRQGLNVTSGVPGPRTRWSFPAGLKSDALHEQITVFNPGVAPAEVEVEVALEDPERNGEVDPFTLQVLPGEFEVFDVDGAEAVPEGFTHSVEVRSTNDVPVVAERSLSATEPAGYRGQLTSTGSPVAAHRWVFAAGKTSDAGQSERIALANPGDEEVEVQLWAFGDGERSAPLRDEPLVLGPGAHIEVALADLGDPPVSATSIEVRATGPVTAERRITSRRAEPEDGEEEGQPGIGASTTVGVPFDPQLLVLDG